VDHPLRKKETPNVQVASSFRYLGSVTSSVCCRASSEEITEWYWC